MQTFQTGFRTTLAQKLDVADTTIELATAPTVTKGRMHVYKGSTHAWIKYTGVTGTTLTGVAFVSQTADPATTVTGTAFSAGTAIELVEMHDQMLDKQEGGTVAGDVQFDGDVVNTLTFKVPVYVNAAARDVAIPSPTNGMEVYLTTEGQFYDYQSGAWGSRATGTSTPNASTTVSGKVEMSTDSEFVTASSTGGTGAFLTPTPSQVVGLVYYGDGSDGDATISTNTSLTKDMYYNNLTVNTGVVLNPAGYAIYVLGTLTLTGTAKIARDGNAASGQTAGAALATGTCGVCLGGVTGGSAPGGNAPGVAVNPSYTNITSAAGGTGGTGFGAPGTGASAAGTRGTLYNKINSLFSVMAILSSPARALALPTSVYGGSPSSGGGGGGGAGNGGTFAAGVGGGSGGNGGNIFVYANILAGTGTISAVGGAGGNGAPSTGSGGSTAAGGGGGGSGGCGGFVTLVYRTGTPYTITLTGGAGGTGGAGPGAAGANGSTGTTGQSVTFQS